MSIGCSRTASYYEHYNFLLCPTRYTFVEPTYLGTLSNHSDFSNSKLDENLC
jgi:hypothetical protein